MIGFFFAISILMDTKALTSCKNKQENCGVQKQKQAGEVFNISP